MTAKIEKALAAIGKRWGPVMAHSKNELRYKPSPEESHAAAQCDCYRLTTALTESEALPDHVCQATQWATCFFWMVQEHGVDVTTDPASVRMTHGRYVLRYSTVNGQRQAEEWPWPIVMRGQKAQEATACSRLAIVLRQWVEDPPDESLAQEWEKLYQWRRVINWGSLIDKGSPLRILRDYLAMLLPMEGFMPTPGAISYALSRIWPDLSPDRPVGPTRGALVTFFGTRPSLAKFCFGPRPDHVEVYYGVEESSPAILVEGERIFAVTKGPGPTNVYLMLGRGSLDHEVTVMGTGIPEKCGERTQHVITTHRKWWHDREDMRQRCVTLPLGRPRADDAMNHDLDEVDTGLITLDEAILREKRRALEIKRKDAEESRRLEPELIERMKLTNAEQRLAKRRVMERSGRRTG